MTTLEKLDPVMRQISALSRLRRGAMDWVHEEKIIDMALSVGVSETDLAQWIAQHLPFSASAKKSAVDGAWRFDRNH